MIHFHRPLPFLLISLFAGIVFFTSNCASDKAEKITLSSKKIFANYYIRYEEDEESLKAEANFQEGDSLQNRTSKQFTSVLLNNKEMGLNEVNPQKPYYQLNIISPLDKEVRFRFINDSGHREEDVIEFARVKNFSVNAPFKRSEDNQLQWNGSPLAERESLVLLFTNEKNRTTSLILKGPTTSSQIKIPAQKLKGLQAGPNNLYLVRKNRSMGDTKSNRVITAVTEYYSSTIAVEVME